MIFLGDSITDADHNFSPKREGEPSLGNGYVRQIADLLETKMPGKTNIRNGGHDGFTVQGLLRMLDYDCLSYKPDVVSILIGSNDAAVCMNTGRTLEATGFAKITGACWGRIQEKNRGSSCLYGPLYLSTAFGVQQMDTDHRKIEETEQRIAGEHQCPFPPSS